jgi:hypothetical protein
MRVMLMLLAVPSVALAMTITLTPAMAEAKAERVVVGTIIDQHAEWVRGRIITFAMLQTETARPEWGRVAVPGGEVDGLGQRVEGAPQFVVGHRYRVALGAANGPIPTDDARCVNHPCTSRGVMGFAAGVVLLPPLPTSTDIVVEVAP